MTEKPQVILPSGQVMKWREQDVPTFYSNIIAFTTSAFDITLTFGEIGQSTPSEVDGIPRAKVILSPEQASNLMKLLTVAVATYVENNGQLRHGGAVDIEELKKQIQAQKVVIAR